ncbi:DNA/RNA nuclease SfsA [Agaricicola taiwanensis]|nr:DNA/RNA nuclease SfsA [Agaricicola taiwanensis]
MQFTAPLLPGRLIQRYKRFLADVALDDGRLVTAHVANSGAMTGLKTPGSRIWLLEKPHTKLGFSWELVEAPLPDGPALVGVNTAHANSIAAEAIVAGRVPELAGYAALRREVPYGLNSRVDIFISDGPTPPAFVEVKNVTLWREGPLAEFPDAVTSRGTKHLADLAREVASGARGVMLYVIQGPAEGFAIAGDVDPVYAEAFAFARSAGVEAYAWTCEVSLHGITLAAPVPILMRG